jgi:hypothetical protein
MQRGSSRTRRRLRALSKDRAELKFATLFKIFSSLFTSSIHSLWSWRLLLAANKVVVDDKAGTNDESRVLSVLDLPAPLRSSCGIPSSILGN